MGVTKMKGKGTSRSGLGVEHALNSFQASNYQILEKNENFRYFRSQSLRLFANNPLFTSENEE